MRVIPLRRFVVVFVAVVIVGCQHTKSALAASMPDGVVIAIRSIGEVTMTVAGKRTTLSADQSVVPRSTIETSANSSVVLAFSNGAMIHLDAGSVLVLEQFSQSPFGGAFNPSQLDVEPSTSVTRLKLQRGELVGRIKQLNRAGGSTFHVETPVGKVQPANFTVTPSSASGGASPQATAPIRAVTVKTMQGLAKDFGGGSAHAIFRIVFRTGGEGAAQFQLSTAVGAVELLSGREPGVVVPQGQEITIAVSVTQNAAGQAIIPPPSTGK